MASGSVFDRNWKGIKQGALEIGEKLGWVTRDTVQRYTQNTNEEKALYQKSPVHQSAVGQVTEFGTEFGLAVAIPMGNGVRGVQLVVSAFATGAALGAVSPTIDGQLSTRLQNAITEGFYTAGGTYVLGKVIPAIKNNEMLKLYATKVWQSSKEFVSHNKFRSPLTFQYDANRLYSGFPIDSIKIRKPWVSKDFLSEVGRLHPSPLLRHEELIIEQWTRERLRLLKQWNQWDNSLANQKMKILLKKCRTQLRERMKPDDLAAIMKENRGIKILKDEGGEFKHFENELKQVQNTFINTFSGKIESLEEKIFLKERFKEISRAWSMYHSMIERAKCKPEIIKSNK